MPSPLTGMGTLSFAFWALMCGRTVVSLAPDDIIKLCTFKGRNGKRKRPVWKDAPGGQQYRTSYNMAPGSFSPVLVASEHFEDMEIRLESERVLTPMKWGLVPPWHQGDPFKVPYETNNCRLEGMLEKKTFKVPLHRGYRCVILVDGFYEWKTTKNGKQPYFFHFPCAEDSSSQLCTDIKDEVTNTIPEKKDFVECLDSFLNDEKVTIKNEIDDDDELLFDAMENNKFDVPVDSKSDSLFSPTSEIENSADPVSKCGKDGNKLKVIAKSSSIWDEIGHETARSQSLVEISNNQNLSTGENYNNGEEDENVSQTGLRLLTIAGVYDIWRSSKNSEPIFSYSIITVPASRDMDWCHHRMPAILPTEKDVNDWLDFANIPIHKASSLIKPQECLTSHPVSKKVNNSRYQDPDCVKPVDLSVESKPKMTASSNMMMNWLGKAQTKASPQTSPIKRPKRET